MNAKTKTIISVVVIAVFLISNIGSFVAGRYTKKDIIRIVTKTEIKTKTIYRDYPKMTCSEMEAELKKYDLGTFLLDGRMISDNVFRAEASLYQRHAERDFTLKAQSKNDTYIRDVLLSFFGGMVVGGIAGGAVDYKIHQNF